MDVARDVIELFSVKDPMRARELAAKLDKLNTDRQEEERRILKSLDERFDADPALCEAGCIVIDGEGWHRGVIGITATRVVERYNRPTLVISREAKKRSVRDARFMRFICWKRLNRAPNFSPATVATRTLAGSPCLRPTFLNCVRGSTHSLARGLLRPISSRCWKSSGNGNSMKSRPRCSPRSICWNLTAREITASIFGVRRSTAGSAAHSER